MLKLVMHDIHSEHNMSIVEVHGIEIISVVTGCPRSQINNLTKGRTICVVDTT